MKALLDTSVLIGRDAPRDLQAAISVVSITELHFGVLATSDPEERARRVARLAAIEAAFNPLPVTVEVARVCGQLAAAVARHGSQPRRRQMDLAIAATALVEGVPLITHNDADFRMIRDLVDVRHLSPTAG